MCGARARQRQHHRVDLVDAVERDGELLEELVVLAVTPLDKPQRLRARAMGIPQMATPPR